jgi:hypothetical protein
VWRAGGRVTLPIDADLSAASDIDIRVMVDPATPPTDLRVRLTDTNGRVVNIVPNEPRLEPLPGTGGLVPKLWASTVRVSLATVPLAMRSRLTSVALISTAATTAYLLDVSAHSLTTPLVTRVALPRVDVMSATVREGDDEHLNPPDCGSKPVVNSAGCLKDARSSFQQEHVGSTSLSSFTATRPSISGRPTSVSECSL